MAPGPGPTGKTTSRRLAKANISTNVPISPSNVPESRPTKLFTMLFSGAKSHLKSLPEMSMRFPVVLDKGPATQLHRVLPTALELLEWILCGISQVLAGDHAVQRNALHRGVREERFDSRD